MKRIYDKEKIAVCLGKSKYHAVFDSLDIDFYLVKYEKGELVSSPFKRNLFSNRGTRFCGHLRYP